MIKQFCLGALLFISPFVIAQKVVEKDFQKFFSKYGVDGCFVLFNQAENEYVKYHSDLCDQGYIPASTFKIPHALIALEEGVVKDTNQVIKWNGFQWDYEPWNKDQTLSSSIKYSCIWVYIGFAEQLGIETYYKYVKEFKYGNQNLTGPKNIFWLKGEFRISAIQQIDFLRKFHHYNLPVSSKNIDRVKNLIVLEKTNEYKLSAKTGAGSLIGENHVMWFVGYVETKGNTYFFALNFESEDFAKTKNARKDIVKDILKELDIIE